MAKKLYVKTYGCQMNVYDSARMTDILAPLGYGPAAGMDDADMVILNTCHIREKAAEKVYSELGRLHRLKRGRQARGDTMIVAVAGCVAQAEGEEVLRRAPFVDIVFGPQSYHHLPELVARACRAGGGVVDTEFPAQPKFDFLPGIGASPVDGRGVSAYLTVQEGCDRFCRFCVVPYTRGAEFSRPVAAIMHEARRLIATGAREIVLLGQNVNAYHGASTQAGDGDAANGQASLASLASLVDGLAGLDGLERIRYTTSHPGDMTPDLIEVHGRVQKLMPFLHLPVQSGSDRVLAAMNRGHGVDEFRRVVARLREARPDIALSSDFIVGYPGETESDFEATMALVDDIGFAQAFSFKYSPRPGTPAAAAPDQVADAVKIERLARLQARLNEQQSSFNDTMVGRSLPVLFERSGRRDGQIVGRGPHMQWVHADAPEAPIGPEALIGQVVDVLITAALPNSLAGQIGAVAGCAMAADRAPDPDIIDGPRP